MYFAMVYIYFLNTYLDSYVFRSLIFPSFPVAFYLFGLFTVIDHAGQIQAMWS